MGRGVISACLVAAAVFDVFGAYVGEGEVSGRVLESHREGSVMVFSLEIASQDVTGPTLATPNAFLYEGTLADEIKPGDTMHLWFHSGADFHCNPCGLFVTKVELADGRTGEGVYDPKGMMSRARFTESSGPEPWQFAAAGLAAILVLAGLLMLRKKAV